jgi:hypothetical protein
MFLCSSGSSLHFGNRIEASWTDGGEGWLYFRFRVKRRAGLWHVGDPDKQNVWRPPKPIFFKLFGLGQGWRTFLRVNAHIVDNLRRNSFACGNSVFTSTVFPIIPVTPYRSVEVGAPCNCTVGETLRPALVTRTYFVCRLSHCSLCIISSNLCL